LFDFYTVALGEAWHSGVRRPVDLNIRNSAVFLVFN